MVCLSQKAKIRLLEKQRGEFPKLPGASAKVPPPRASKCSCSKIPAGEGAGPRSCVRSQGWPEGPGLALMCCSRGEWTLSLPEYPTGAWEGGNYTFFAPGCAEEFMSCPSGEWTWAEHHQHCVLGKLCPPGFGAAQRLLAFNYKQLNNVSQLTAGKRKGRNGS